MKKIVSFHLVPTVHHLFAYDFAYRQCRKGIWEQMARDRVRFQNRIYLIEPKITEVLNQYHRTKIFEERNFGIS